MALTNPSFTEEALRHVARLDERPRLWCKKRKKGKRGKRERKKVEGRMKK
jgi:hypothetical protein